MVKMMAPTMAVVLLLLLVTLMSIRIIMMMTTTVGCRHRRCCEGCLSFALCSLTVSDITGSATVKVRSLDGPQR